MNRRALITGTTGQDGSYLAELLLREGYTVTGVTSGKTDHKNVASVESQIEWVTGDITDQAFVRNAIKKHSPQEIYNLASVSSVTKPWEDVTGITRATALTPLYFLEGIREIDPTIRFFQASSAEMYGVTDSATQNEETPLRPVNPYGIAKTFVHQLIQGYRDQHGLFATSGILFNHESPRRGEHFVTRKITMALAKIQRGLQENVSLGNLDAKRDWGFAGDYVRAMQLMLSQEKAGDYVIATGVRHSVREFIEAACTALSMPLTWKGEGLEEVGVTTGDRVIITINKEFYRPVEKHILCGDSTKATRELGWKPEITFDELVSMMVQADAQSLSTT